MRTKEQLVTAILRQEFYPTSSLFYQLLFDRMMKLPMGLLQDLDMLLTMRVIESNDLAKKVDKILNDTPRRSGADLVSGFDCLG